MHRASITSAIDEQVAPADAGRRKCRLAAMLMVSRAKRRRSAGNSEAVPAGHYPAMPMRRRVKTMPDDEPERRVADAGDHHLVDMIAGRIVLI